MKMQFVVIAAVLLYTCVALADNQNVAGEVIVDGKGHLAVIDCLSGMDWSLAEKAFQKLDESFHIKVIRKNGQPFSLETASQQAIASGANAVLFVGNVDKYPLSLVATEQRWAFVNLHDIQISGVNVANRTRVLLMRGLYRALGSDIARAASLCLAPVYKIEDLDKITELGVSMDTYISISESCTALGIEPIQYFTYEEACELGIAPAPTNAVQKAIWDKVHALPTKPIKILPPNQKK